MYIYIYIWYAYLSNGTAYTCRPIETDQYSASYRYFDYRFYTTRFKDLLLLVLYF